MAEGGTYLSAWSLETGTFRLWLPEHPDITASGTNFEATAEELSQLIAEWNGDGEAVLEFPRGRPATGKPGVLLALRSLGYNESVKGLNRDPAQFQEGICGHCQYGVGGRTEAPLEIDRLPKSNVAGVDRTLPRALIVSEQFLALLDDTERSALRTQEARGPRGRRFFELVGDPITDSVGLVGAEYPSAFHQSWQCQACHRREFVVDHPEFTRGTTFVSSASLILPPPTIFVFDAGPRLIIAVSTPRWTELAGQPGAKGFVTDDVLVVDETLSDPAPDLPRPEEFDWAL